MSDLTNDEQQYILVKAKLAKTIQQLAELQKRAADLFQKPTGGITSTTYGGGPSPELRPRKIFFFPSNPDVRRKP